MSVEAPIWLSRNDTTPRLVEARRKAGMTCGAIGMPCLYSRPSTMFPDGVQDRAVIECALHTHRMTPYHAPHPRQVFAADVCATWTPQGGHPPSPEPDYDELAEARARALWPEDPA